MDEAAPVEPLSEGPFEQDEYDDRFAEYLVVRDAVTRQRLGSLRLLRTDRPHILGSIFPDLCEGGAPAGPSIREVTQLSLSPDLPSRERRLVGRQLATALAEYGLLMGITAYTAVMEWIWFRHIQALGWRCEPLGLGRQVGDALLGAFQVYIDAGTIASIREAGCYVASAFEVVETDRAPSFNGCRELRV